VAGNGPSTASRAGKITSGGGGRRKEGEAVTTRKVRPALLAVAAAGTAAAIAGAVAVKDGWDHPPLAEPLERRAGYREHKRACLDSRAGDDRRGMRERSCRAWQEMLAQERERLTLEEVTPTHPIARAPEPR
jgi:hypothetical protein